MADTQPIFQILLIDDECDKMQDFIDLAAQYCFNVTPYSNYEEGMAALEKEPNKYQGVILDALSFMTPDDEVASNPKAMRASINRLNSLRDKSNRIYPYCVYTGYIDDIQDGMEDEIEIFVKGKDQEKLFDWLESSLNNLEETRIIQQYSDVFTVFDEGWLPFSKRPELVSIIQQLQNPKIEELKGAISQIRSFTESICLGLNSLASKYMPDEFITGSKINHEYALRYLTGRHVELRDRSKNRVLSPEGHILPGYLGWMLQMLFKSSSEVGSHNFTDSFSPHTYHSLVHALLELIIWYTQFVRTNYPTVS